MSFAHIKNIKTKIWFKAGKSVKNQTDFANIFGWDLRRTLKNTGVKTWRSTGNRSSETRGS